MGQFFSGSAINRSAHRVCQTKLLVGDWDFDGFPRNTLIYIDTFCDNPSPVRRHDVETWVFLRFDRAVDRGELM